MFKIQDKPIDFDVGIEKESFSLWTNLLKNYMAKDIKGKYELFNYFQVKAAILDKVLFMD